MGYCTTIHEVDLELRRRSIVVTCEDEKEIDGDVGRVEIGEDLLSKLTSALMYLDAFAYDRDNAVAKAKLYESRSAQSSAKPTEEADHAE